MDKKHKDLIIAADLSEVSAQMAMEEVMKMIADNNELIPSYCYWLECNLLQCVPASQIALAIEDIEGVKVSKWTYDQGTWRVMYRDSACEYSVGSPGA